MTFLFRTDASPMVGTGHIMRCLALAQTMHDAGDTAAFLTASITPSLTERLAKETLKVIALSAVPYGEEDARETAETARSMGAAWVIVDGYSFTGAYQDHLKKQGMNVLFVDDYGHAKRYSADAIVNQNIGAAEDLYKNRDDKTTLLLGTRFVLLQRIFRDHPRPERLIPRTASRLLVTLGGGDPDNVTEKTIEAVRGAEGLDVTVVIGGANPHAKSLQSLCEDAGMQSIVNATDMRALMDEADMALSAGGTTNYELAYLGIPALTITLADNQRAVTAGMAAAGASISLGWHEDVTPEMMREKMNLLRNDQKKRAYMATRGTALVDGDGADRVLRHLHEDRLRLRPARPGDAELLWQWANDPVIRQSAFSQDPIPWKEHLAWFQKKLRSSDTVILLAFDAEDEPVGQIRFDRDASGSAEIDLHLSPAQRGKGYGQDVLTAGIERMRRTRTVRRFSATVKEGNTPSIRAFEKAGFRLKEAGQRDTDAVLSFILD
jgi:UDP-2,4-diacetamido-2,4,6-trideoxy-beta-L-altropyranose hydrolase